jgi:hypothetical protein
MSRIRVTSYPVAGASGHCFAKYIGPRLNLKEQSMLYPKSSFHNIDHTSYMGGNNQITSK